MSLDLARFAGKIRGYMPQPLSDFERVVEDNWDRDPLAVWTIVRNRVKAAATERKLDVRTCLVWCECMLSDIAKRKLSPFAVPNEIDENIRRRFRLA